MKKLLAAFFALSLFSVFAELHPARRYFEIGTTVNIEAAENIMPVADIFKKNLVIDLKKIYSDMGDDGATVSVSAKENFFINFNFKKFGIGLDVGSQASVSANISKDLFKVLDGLVPGAVYNGEASVWAESFATFSVPVRFNVDKWKVKITPTYFVPCFYLPSTTVRGWATHGLDGSITAVATAPLEFYTISEFKGLIVDGEFSLDFIDNIDANSLLSDVLKSGGIDIGAEIEYPILEKLDLGGYFSSPIVPGHLRHKVTAFATASIKSNSIMQMAFDEESPDTYYDFGDPVYSDCDFTVNRPLRFGVECAWRPFGKWLTLRGKAGAALRNPFGEDVTIKSFYPEYRLGVDLSLFGMLGLNLSTEYSKKIFAHGVGIMLNFRAVELDVLAAVCSPNFVKSFKGEGARVGVGIKFGW